MPKSPHRVDPTTKDLVLNQGSPTRSRIRQVASGDDVFDAAIAGVAVVDVNGPLTLSAAHLGRILHVSNAAARVLTLFAAAEGFCFRIKMLGDPSSPNTVTLARAGSGNVEGADADFVFASGWAGRVVLVYRHNSAWWLDSNAAGGGGSVETNHITDQSGNVITDQSGNRITYQ